MLRAHSCPRQSPAWQPCLHSSHPLKLSTPACRLRPTTRGSSSRPAASPACRPHPVSPLPLLRQPPATTTATPQRRAVTARVATADFKTFQEVTDRIYGTRTLRQLAAYVHSAPRDANTAASAIMRAGAIWKEREALAATTPQDVQDAEYAAWQELQAALPPMLLEFLPVLPVDTQVAVVIAAAQLEWDSADAVALFDGVAAAVVGGFEGAMAHEKADAHLMLLAAAYTTAGHYNSQLMEWLGSQLAARLPHMDNRLISHVQLVGTVMQYFMDVRHHHPELLASTRSWLLQLMAAAGQAPIDDDPDSLVMIGLAFATFEAGDRELYNTLMVAIARCPRLKGMSPTTAACLQVLSILIQDSGVQLPRAAVEVMLQLQREYPGGVVRKSRTSSLTAEVLQHMVMEGLAPEQLQHLREQHLLMGMEVEETLRLVGLPVARNGVGADGFIGLHMVTEYKGQDVVLQLCDDMDFCSKPYWRFKGVVLNELRALERLRYKVVAVPWFEWERLGDEPQRARYLLDGIQKAVER